MAIKGYSCIPHSSSITGSSPSEDTYWSGGGSYLSAETQLVYSTAPVDKAKHDVSQQQNQLDSWHNDTLFSVNAGI